MVQEIVTAADGDLSRANRTLGRVVPRASDERLLQDMADRLERGDVTRAGRVTT